MEEDWISVTLPESERLEEDVADRNNVLINILCPCSFFFYFFGETKTTMTCLGNGTLHIVGNDFSFINVRLSFNTGEDSKKDSGTST